MQQRNTTRTCNATAKKSFLITLLFLMVMPGCTRHHNIYSMGAYNAMQDVKTPEPGYVAETTVHHYTVISLDTVPAVTDSITIEAVDTDNYNCCFSCPVSDYMHGDAGLLSDMLVHNDVHDNATEQHMQHPRLSRILRFCMLFFLVVIFI